MTDGWDERTEAIPGTRGEKSLELGVDFASEPSVPPTVAELDSPTDGKLPTQLSLVVFDPAQVGLAKALTKLGYHVRSGATGVDVMSIVATHAPGAVVCASTPDSERRRLLAAVLRLRFPHVPIVYASTHAHQEEAVLGAMREGARAVIAWPLPEPVETARILGPFVRKPSDETEVLREGPPTTPAPVPPASRARPSTKPAPRMATRASVVEEPPTGPQRPSPALDEPRTDPIPRPDSVAAKRGKAPPSTRPGKPAVADSSLDASFDSDFEDAHTQVVDLVASGKSKSAVRAPTTPPPVPLPVAPATGPSTSMGPPRPPQRVPTLPKQIAPPPPVLGSGPDDLEQNTQPGLRPAPVAAVEALQEKRGEIGELLAAISPFLWSLEDAARWADALAAEGNTTAAGHARELHLLAKILAQLQARIDDLGA